MVSYYEVHAIFQGIKHQLRENTPHHLLHYIFYSIFIEVSSIYSKLFSGGFCDIARPHNKINLHPNVSG